MKAIADEERKHARSQASIPAGPRLGEHSFLPLDFPENVTQKSFEAE
jgi:hypothetical protein